MVCADTTRLNKVADGRATVELAKGLISEGVRGVILKPVGFSGDGEVVNAGILSLFSDKSIPVVLVDSDAVRAPGRRGLDLIALDNFQAGCSLASHLIERRVRRIAFVARQGYADSVRRRLAGVQSVAGTGHVDLLLANDCANSGDLQSAFHNLRELDAVICQNDVMAACVQKTLAQLGLSVPRDVLLAGFDDASLALSMRPRLTTIRQPCKEMASAAFQRLAERMRNPSMPATSILFQGELMARGSTDIFRPKKVV